MIKGLKGRGFKRNNFYPWVASEELTLARIRERVSLGGQDVPKEMVRRRFVRLVRNFLGP